MISAMTELIVLFLLVAVMALATLREIHHDGSGHTAPPRSHEPDAFEPRRFA